MNTLYTNSQNPKLPIYPVAISLLLTGSLFALLPILHLIPNLWIFDPGIKPDLGVKEIPPVFVEPIPEPEKPKLKQKPPEIKKELNKIDLKQLEVLIHAGHGDGHNYINIGDPAELFKSEGFEDLYEISDLDQKPKALFQIEPVYPYSLKNRRIEGWVLLEWIITEEGRVTSIKAVQYSNREFVQPAIDSISKSKWEPGEISSKRVNTKVRQKITFNL